MSKPDILIVDGYAFGWQRLSELRRVQLVHRPSDCEKAFQDFGSQGEDCSEVQPVGPSPTPPGKIE